MKDQSKRWLEFAEEDLKMAELAFGEGLWNQACFHCQQCAEKALKAILCRHGHSIPRTHKLADLVFLIGEGALLDLADDLRSMDRFYIPTRYPDAVPGSLPGGLPCRKDAEEALSLASRLIKVAKDNVMA